MVSLTLVAVGFLAATAVVIALARGSTARWERAKRAPVAVRAELPTRPTSSAGSLSRMPGALSRRVAALLSQASRSAPVKVISQALPKGVEQGTSRARPGRRIMAALRFPVAKLRAVQWTRARSAALPRGDEPETTVAPEPSRAATDTRRSGVRGAAGHRLFRRTVPRVPRRALAFLHRHVDPHDEGIQRESTEESPPARS